MKKFPCRLLIVAVFLLISADTSHANDATSAIGSRFILTSHTGKVSTDEDFRDRFMLVSFGYTFCPDICPTALATMAAALDELGADGEQINPVFISLDPKRDTPQRLADYVPNFHPRLVGLTGAPAMIARVAKGYRVKYTIVPAPDGDPDNYSLDHTASIYLMDPDGAFLVKFAHAMDAEAMALRIRDFLD